MCLDVECEYDIISGPNWRKARKSHRCNECARIIGVGERYFRYAMKEWGERTLTEMRMCEHCRMTIEVGAAISGCPESWWWDKVHDLDPDDGGFVGDVLHHHELSQADRFRMLRTVVGRKWGWRRPSGALLPVPTTPSTARNAEDEVTRCAGRSTAPHPSTVMVDGRCPVCGENESERCWFVVGHQHGEPVMCGAVKSIHGDGLGMARHEFVPPRPSTQVT